MLNLNHYLSSVILCAFVCSSSECDHLKVHIIYMCVVFHYPFHQDTIAISINE